MSGHTFEIGRQGVPFCGELCPCVTQKGAGGIGQRYPPAARAVIQILLGKIQVENQTSESEESKARERHLVSQKTSKILCL